MSLEDMQVSKGCRWCVKNLTLEESHDEECYECKEFRLKLKLMTNEIILELIEKILPTVYETIYNEGYVAAIREER